MTTDELLARRLPGSVDGVLALMHSLEQALPRRDGVRSFLTLYRAVTEDVHALVGPVGDYGDPRFVRWLDVVFAGLFFRASETPRSGPARCRRPGSRSSRHAAAARSAPLQFALAGMNAHINRDLPFALLQTWKARQIEPSRRSVQYEDFTRINALLEQTEDRVKAELLTGALGHVDRSLGTRRRRRRHVEGLQGARVRRGSTPRRSGLCERRPQPPASTGWPSTGSLASRAGGFCGPSEPDGGREQA